MAKRKPSNQSIETYVERLTRSIEVFREHKKQLREARQAYKQIMPESIIDVATGDSSQASAILHPQYRYIVKRFIEDLTALPLRFEYSSNTKEGEIARVESEAKLRMLMGETNIISAMDKLYIHSVSDGLGIVQTLTKIKQDEIIDPNGEVYPHNQRRIFDLQVYDPITTYLDPNADGSNIVETSEYIIVTIGVFDEAYIELNFPEYLEQSSKTSSIKDKNSLPMGIGQTGWIDDGEDLANEEDSGVTRQTQERFKIREYYTADGFYYTIINDEWMSEPLIVSNGVADRVPFNIVATIHDVDNAMGESMFQLLRTPLAMASKAINSIADAVGTNVNMPYFTFEGSGIEGINMSDLDDNGIYSLKKIQDIKAMRDMWYKPQIPEVTPGAQALMNEGSQMMYLLTGTNPTSITGGQTTAIPTNGVAEMLERAGMRSNSSFARKIEMILNGILWDFFRIFFIYYKEFDFDPQTVSQEFFVDFANIRVVPGSYLPEDKLSRLARAQEVLNLAKANPGGFELTVVFGDFLKALGITVPERILKSAEENLMEVMAQQVAQAIGPGWKEDKQLVGMIEQIAQMASTKDDMK